MNLKPDGAAEQIPGQPGTHSKGYLSDTPPLTCESLTHTSNELEGAARCWVGGWRREHSCGLNTLSEWRRSLLPQQDKTAEGHHGRRRFGRLEGKRLWKSDGNLYILTSALGIHTHGTGIRARANEPMPSCCPRAMPLNPRDLQSTLGAHLRFGSTCVATITQE